MQKPKISIIVPIYNRREYIAKTLDNLLGQTIRDIDIICVNDGSTDGTEKVLAEYAKKDKRIKVMNKDNGGCSTSRNAGLKQCRAEYIMFCDSDDLFDLTMCEKMYKAMTKEIDIAICGIKVEYLAHNEIKYSDDIYYNLDFNKEQEISDEVIHKTDTSVCNKIFRKSIIEKYGISFPEQLNNEDYYFYNAYMSVSKKAYFVNEKLYYYIRHDDSIMSDNFDGDIYSPDHLLIAQKLFSFYEKNGFLKEHMNLFWTQFVESFWFSYNHSSKQYRKKILGIAKKFINDHKKDYPPTTIKMKNAVGEIINMNPFVKAMKKMRSAIGKVMRKIK